MDYEYVVGYTYGENGYERTPIAANAENIASFLVANGEKSETVITTPLDTVFIIARYGIIDKCMDQEYLIHNLLPVLAPMQMGFKEPKPVEVFDETQGYDGDLDSEYINESENEDETER